MTGVSRFRRQERTKCSTVSHMSFPISGSIWSHFCSALYILTSSFDTFYTIINCCRPDNSLLHSLGHVKLLWRWRWWKADPHETVTKTSEDAGMYFCIGELTLTASHREVAVPLAVLCWEAADLNAHKKPASPSPSSPKQHGPMWITRHWRWDAMVAMVCLQVLYRLVLVVISCEIGNEYWSWDD